MASKFSKLKNVSNEEYYNEVIKNSPKFRSYTAAGTQGRLTQAGVEALDQIPEAKSDFFATLLRVVWQKLDTARAENDFEKTGVMENWEVPRGEYTQRMSVNAVMPISPQYRGLVNGGTTDPFLIWKPTVNERFFPLNYDYQALTTIQNIDFKRILLEDGQTGALMAGLMQGIDTGRVIQENVLTKYALNQGLNSTIHPLSATQSYSIESITSNDIASYTNDQLVDLIVALGDIFSGMFAVDNPATGMYNALGFKTRVESDQYVMFMRTGLKNRINKITRAGTYNPEYLNLEIDNRIYDINDFGGLVPYTDETHTTQLYPVFNMLGGETGYYITADNATSVGDTLTLKQATSNGVTETIGYQIAKAGIEASSIANVVSEGNIAPDAWVDPNANVLAVILQKGVLGINRQNGFTVEPAYSQPGMYTSYWANSPNNGIYFDYQYNVIVIKTAATA